MSKHKTVIVANRLPVTVKRNGEELHFERSNGGLATAMSSLEAEDKQWVGWPGIASDDLTDEEQAFITKKLAEMDCLPVFLTKEQISLFYEGYANDTLWPLFHYFQDKTIYHRAYWSAYREVNKLYERAVKKVAQADATIWVHDYQLMLLPRLVRKVLPEARIGYFHHVPFPSFEIFRLLPERREIIEGLLGADLVGFHVFDYARHFLSSTLRLLGIDSYNGMVHYDERTVHVDAFPIGIDYKSFRDTRKTDDAVAARQSLEDTYVGEKIILSIDRLDYSKGIPERLDGYQRFLEEYPQFLGKVRLVMVAVPSRTDIETYKQLRDQIEVTVSRINGEFGTSEWAPISYQFQNLPFAEIVALYAQADVMLVTPLRDGMNLVAKEFVAAKGDEPGVLVLSEMTGAVEELPESVVVNPNDVNRLARAIKQALEMPKKEQLSRLATMQDRLREYTVVKWGQDFMETLARVTSQSADPAKKLTVQTRKDIAAEVRSAKNALVVIDYDGTLSEHKASPSNSAATPSKTLLNNLTVVANRKNIRLCVASGRSMETLESWFGELPIDLIADHGVWVKSNGTWRSNEIDFEEARAVATDIIRGYTSRTPGSRVEQKDYATVWHYRNTSVELAQVRAHNLLHELQMNLAHFPVSVNQGNFTIEITPSQTSKKTALGEILTDAEPDVTVIAGDDYSDELMFEIAPPDAYTIKVGPGETRAAWRVPHVAAFARLLTAIGDK
jgi:trehalose 6-phosphate synthase/phosphatase